eukprot:598115-Hanusia_phi.AAC.2
MQKRAQMEQMRQQMMGDDSDGLPVFNVFVRSKRAGIWYPAGTLKGDARSKSLVEAWRDNSLFLKDQYKVSPCSGSSILRAALLLQPSPPRPCSALRLATHSLSLSLPPSLSLSSPLLFSPFPHSHFLCFSSVSSS